MNRKTDDTNNDTSTEGHMPFKRGIEDADTEGNALKLGPDDTGSVDASTSGHIVRSGRIDEADTEGHGARASHIDEADTEGHAAKAGRIVQAGDDADGHQARFKP